MIADDSQDRVVPAGLLWKCRVSILRNYPWDVANVVASLFKTTTRMGGFVGADQRGVFDAWNRRAWWAERRKSPLGPNLRRVANLVNSQDLSELGWLYFQAGRNAYSFIVWEKHGHGETAAVVLTGRGVACLR